MQHEHTVMMYSLQTCTRTPAQRHVTHVHFQGILRNILRQEGVRGLFRGILPGLSKSFVSNGMAMIALNFTQRSLSVEGGREDHDGAGAVVGGPRR
jgi:hypothetical protein